MNSLVIISSVAPFIGFFGTVLGILNSFRPIIGERSSNLPIITRFLSESLVPTTLGLSVALVAYFFYRYLLAESEAFDVEIGSASLQLINDLASTNI